jgi:DNA-binding response OmpR family regulator
MAQSILIIDDDPDLARLAQRHLAESGYDVVIEEDGEHGCRRALNGGFDLLLVDWMLPGMDGLEICRRVRAQERYTPILILTARSGEPDRVLGLEIGADDYLTKPLSLRELLARVRAIFRRVEALERQAPGEFFRRGELWIDLRRREVRLAGTPVELTAKEFDLLVHFASHPGRVYTRSDLVDALWGAAYEGYEHTVNSHINRLRAKINSGGPRQRFIETVWGVGYRFQTGGCP